MTAIRSGIGEAVFVDRSSESGRGAAASVVVERVMPTIVSAKHMLKSSDREEQAEGMTATAEIAPAFTLTVSDVATAAGVAPSAVRFYEKHGIITAQRTSGDQRRFDESASCRIKVAKVAQGVGLTVREIAAVFGGLPRDPRPADWARVADVLTTEAEARLANLRSSLESLRSGGRLCEINDDQHAALGNRPDDRVRRLV